MANSLSALKRVRQIETRTAANRVVKTRVKSLRKAIDDAVETKDQEEATKALSDYSSAVDRAAKKGIFHKNKAANLKSKAAASVKAGSN